MNEPKPERFYSKDAAGNEHSYVMLMPRLCSRCRTFIAENAYFVHCANPGMGACWNCYAEAKDWERFQLERGQAGLNAWLEEQAAKRRTGARHRNHEEEIP